MPRYEVGRPHTVIAEALDKVLSGEIDRLMLCIPPRHGKSELASRRMPAYALGHKPDWQIISTSTDAGMASDFGRDVRNIVASQEYQRLFQTRLAADSQAKGKWHTDKGGMYYAVGVEGQILGRGGDLIIIDDPYSTWKDAQSETTRRTVEDWYRNTIYNRLMPGGRIVVICHRMHENDLCGFLMQEAKDPQKDQWHVISLPAIDQGCALWPERYPLDSLGRTKATMVPYAWSALYQQDPTPEDGDYFKRWWISRHTELPKHLNVYMSGDFAVTDDDGDFTELAVWGVDSVGNLYALDWWHGQTSADIWIERLIAMFKRWKPAKFIGEQGPIRRAVEPYLRKAMMEEALKPGGGTAWTVLEWLPHGGEDKPAKCRSFQAMAANGRVFWPHVDWAERVIAQMLKFPNATHDDAVDTCGLIGRFVAEMWSANEPPREVVPVFDAPMKISDILRPTAAPSW